MSGLLMSQLGLGVATGASNVVNTNTKRASEEAKAGRDAARLKQQQMQEKLRVAKGVEATDADIEAKSVVQSQELKKLQMQNEKTLAELAKTDTMGALGRFGGDHDVRHLNSLLGRLSQSGSESARNLYGSVATLQNINKSDINGLTRAGFDAEKIFTNKEAQQDILRVIGKDGKVSYTDVDTIRATTGYTQYMRKEELEFQKKKRDGVLGKANAAERSIERELTDPNRPGGALTPGTPEYKTAFVNAEKQRNAPKAKNDSNVLASIKRQVANDFPDLEPGSDAYKAKVVELEKERRVKDANPYDNNADAQQAYFAVVSPVDGSPGLTPNDSGFLQAYNKKLGEIKTEKRIPSKQRNLNAGFDASENIDKILGKSFFDVDVTPEWRKSTEGMKVGNEVIKIEELAGQSMVASQVKEIADIVTLVNTGSPASALTEDQVGLFDNTFHFMKTYITNDVQNVDRSAAFAMYRNLTRHALYGAALTPGEAKSFNEQFGTLNQQPGPLLQALKANLEQVKSKLQAVQQVGHPQVTHYRLGMSDKKLDKILSGIDERIAFLTAKSRGEPYNVKGSAQTKKQNANAKRRQKLDKIKANLKAGKPAYDTPTKASKGKGVPGMDRKLARETIAHLRSQGLSKAQILERMRNLEPGK